MKLKLLLIIAIGIFYVSHCRAQTQSTYYFNNSGMEVKTRDSADYIRIVSAPDSGSTFFNVADYYINGKPKLLGKSSKANQLVLEGNYETFYPSGIKKEVATCKAGLKDGESSIFYPNGQLYTVKQSTPNKNSGTTYILIKSCMDSTGKVLAINSTGYYIGYHSNFIDIDEEGKINAGLRDGDWKGGSYGKKGKITFTEKYEKGQLIEGVSVYNDTSICHYTVREIAPGFTGGEQAFARYLIRHVKYPKESRDYGIQGRVFVNFVVEKDGRLTDLKV